MKKYTYLLLLLILAACNQNTTHDSGTNRNEASINDSMDEFLKMPKTTEKIPLGEFYLEDQSKVESLLGSPVAKSPDSSNLTFGRTYKNKFGRYDITYKKGHVYNIVYTPAVFINWNFDGWEQVEYMPSWYQGVLSNNNFETGIKDDIKYHTVKMPESNIVVNYTEKWDGIGNVTIGQIRTD